MQPRHLLRIGVAEAELLDSALAAGMHLPKGLLNNNLYKTEEVGYVLSNESLRETGQDVTFADRTLLVAGHEYLE